MYLVPIFIQLIGGRYNDKEMYFNIDKKNPIKRGPIRGLKFLVC